MKLTASTTESLYRDLCPEAPVAKTPTRQERASRGGLLSSTAARIGVAAITLLGAAATANCGDDRDEGRHDDRDRNECCAPVDPCEQDDCYVDPCECPEVEPAPQIEGGDAYLVQGNVMRVPFTVPDFDVKRKGPLTVTILANLTRNPEGSASYGRSDSHSNISQVMLAQGVTVSAPGESFVDGELPQAFDSIISYQLVVVDAEGQEFLTSPTSFGG